MSLSEFELIKKYFSNKTSNRNDVSIGVGDDAAVLKVPPEHQLVLSIDTLVEGVHFLKDVDPRDLGYKSIAVSLSDLAAMGATPAWVTMALTLPKIDDAWLQPFCDGMFEILNEHSVDLIGGDLTYGSLTISVQSHGFVPMGKAIPRSGAKPGDKIYVTGNLGDAGLALKILTDEIKIPKAQANRVIKKLTKPTPKINLGIELRDIASSAIDISDGLAADLGHIHILEQSNVGATINTNDLPISKVLQNNLSEVDAYLLALTAGDDYELCFTVPEELTHKLKRKYTCIGKIDSQKGLRCITVDNQVIEINKPGYQHF